MEDAAAILKELADLGLGIARDLAAREAAAETPAEAAQLASAFHKVSRSLRQTLALKDKLEREAKRTQPTPPKPPRPKTREDRIRDEVSRLIWDEYEDDEDEAYDLEDQLEDIMEQDFPDIPESDIVAQIAEHLGLRSSPLGEGNREAVEGVEAHQPLKPEPANPESLAPQPPQSASADSSPGGEHLEPEPLPPVVYSTTGYPIANLRRPPLGLPGEYPPWEEQEWQDSA